MSATPPPTCNTLDPFQRARLVRSARKLGHILGATPILLESTNVHEPHDLNELHSIESKFDSFGSRSVVSSSNKGQPAKLTAKAIRRHGSLFDISVSLDPAASLSSSSLSFLSSSVPTASANANTLRNTSGFSAARQRKAGSPTPLILKVITVSVNKDDRRLNMNMEPPESPSSPLVALSNMNACTLTYRRSRSSSMSLSFGCGTDAGVTTPLTPSVRLHTAAIRRRKLQKLAYMLGENVPPSVVFPGSPDTDFSAPTSPVSRMSKSPTPKTPTSGGRRASMLNNRRRSASMGLLPPFGLNLRLPIDLPARIPSKNGKGVSHWEPPSEWAVGPTEDKEQEDDQVMIILKEDDYDDYDSVIHQLPTLRK